MGDKVAVYRLSTGTVITTAALNLAAKFAVSGDAGTVTMTVTNQTLAGINIPGVSGTEEHTGTVIKVAPALDEDAMALNATADVAESFKKFLGEATTVSLGSLQVGFESTYRNAGTDGAVIAALTEVILTADDADGDPAEHRHLHGRFPFVDKVYTHGDDDCGTAATGTDTGLAADETDLLIRDDDMMVSDTTKTMAVNIIESGAEFTGTNARHLCIMVQGDDTEGADGKEAPRIPETGAYTAMGSYTGIADAAIGPKPQEQTLGMIMRNGTTVQIPYLTTYEGYNQRVVMSNRGAADARYEIEYRAEDGITPMPKVEEGMLMGGTTVVMSSTDLVEFSGGSRGAATIILEAESGNIDVTSVTVNKESRDTDTVVHH